MFYSGWKDKTPVCGNERALTVRQRLEQANAIILMDAKSAARGTERVEREIEALSEMREKFNEFCESYDARSAGEEDREGEGRKLINTRVGIMEYRLMPDSSSYDLSEPRLLRPNGPIGDLYAKMESLFKDKIAPRLGIVIQPQPQLLTDSYGGPDGRLLVYRFV